MKTVLDDIQAKFGVSKAVFKGSLSHDKDFIRFECQENYDPNSADLDHNDPVVKLMVGNYSERFSKDDGFQAQDATSATTRQIYDFLRKAFLSASPLKSPEQSKLYKWMDFDKFYRLFGLEGMISLFRYVRQHTTDESRFYSGKDSVHAKNYVAILEKAKEKYERQR